VTRASHGRAGDHRIGDRDHHKGPGVRATPRRFGECFSQAMPSRSRSRPLFFRYHVLLRVKLVTGFATTTPLELRSRAPTSPTPWGNFLWSFKHDE
jgi:hypothetical protein